MEFCTIELQFKHGSNQQLLHQQIIRGLWPSCDLRSIHFQHSVLLAPLSYNITASQKYKHLTLNVTKHTSDDAVDWQRERHIDWRVSCSYELWWRKYKMHNDGQSCHRELQQPGTVPDANHGIIHQISYLLHQLNWHNGRRRIPFTPASQCHYHCFIVTIQTRTKMWANAQRDGRPAVYRSCPLFNAAKFGWRPLLECRAVTLPRRQTRWNLLGYPKLANRSQPLVGRRSPYCGDIAV